MFGLKLVNEAKYDALQAELKGYTEQHAEGADAYFNAVASQVHGTQLPPMTQMQRELIKDVYETNSAVQGVINYIARNVSEVWSYLELINKRTGDVDEGHWLNNLLAHPNERYNGRRYAFGLAVNYCLFGDAWQLAPIEAGKDRIAKQMFIIPSHKVAVKTGNKDDLFKGIDLQMYGKLDEIEAKDVIESFTYNLDDTSFFGTSKVVAAALYIKVIQQSMQRESEALNNGGPANVVSPAASTQYVPLKPEIDETQQKLNGKKNANKNVVLRHPIDVKKLGDNPVDLSVLESHKEAVTALCFAFEIPVDLYYGQAKYENAKEAKKATYEQVAIPMCNEFAADILAHFGLEKDYELKVNTDMIDVLKDKASDTLDCLTKMHASLNELRESFGYDRIEEPYADQPMLPLGTQFGNETYDIDETV